MDSLVFNQFRRVELAVAHFVAGLGITAAKQLLTFQLKSILGIYHITVYRYIGYRGTGRGTDGYTGGAQADVIRSLRQRSHAYYGTMVVGIRTLNIVAQVIEGKIAVVLAAPAPVDVILVEAVPTVKVEAVPYVVALVTGIDYAAATSQLVSQQFMPGVIATLITVTAVTYAGFGETIIGLEVTGNVIGNGTRPLGTILHVDEYTAVVEQTSHLVVVVGTRENGIPIVVGLVIEVHTQYRTGLIRIVRFRSRTTQGITYNRECLTHGHSHTTYIGTATGATRCSRAIGVIRYTLIPGYLHQRLDAVFGSASHYIACPAEMTLQSGRLARQLNLIGIIFQPALYPGRLTVRHILTVKRIAQQRVYRIFSRNQSPSPFFKTYDVVHGNTLLRNGFYCGISAFERRAATHG